QRVELLRRDRLVAAPPHGLLGRGVADRILVLRAATGEHAGVRAQRTVGGQHRFAGSERILIELRRAEIPVHPFEIFETEFVGAEGTVAHARLLHEDSLLEPAYFIRAKCRHAPLAVTSTLTRSAWVGRPNSAERPTCQADPRRDDYCWASSYGSIACRNAARFIARPHARQSAAAAPLFCGAQRIGGDLSMSPARARGSAQALARASSASLTNILRSSSGVVTRAGKSSRNVVSPASISSPPGSIAKQRQSLLSAPSNRVA